MLVQATPNAQNQWLLTGRGKAGGTDEVLGSCELLLKIGLELEGSVRVGRTIVESLVSSSECGRDGCREGKQSGG